MAIKQNNINQASSSELRALDEEHRKETFGMYTDFYDCAPLGYLILEQDTTILEANLTAATMLGVERSRLSGMHFKQFVIPEDHRVLEALLDKVFVGMIAGYDEVMLVTVNNQQTAVPHIFSGSTVRLDASTSETSSPCRVILSDITRQKQTEEVLRRQSRALLAMNHCNQAMIHTNDEIELLHHVCRIMVEIGGYRMAWVGYAEHNEEKSVSVLAEEGFVSDYNQHHKLSWADVPQGRGPVGITIRTARSCAVNHIHTDPIFEPWRQEALRHRFASLLTLPLKAESEAFGVLTIYSATPDAFDTDETKLLVALADNLAYGITALRNRKISEETEKALRKSERKFRSITEQMTDEVFVIDSIGTLAYVSPVVEKLFGYLPYEVIGHSFIDYIEEADIPEAIQVFNKTLHFQTSNQMFEVTLKRKDRSHFDAEIHLQYYQDQDFSGMIGLIRDITERNLIENQLLKLSTAIEQSPAVVLITDACGTIEYVNPTFTKLTGYSIEYAKGKNSRILQSGLTPKSVYDELWKTILSGRIWRGEWQNKKKNGALFWESVVISVILNAEGVITNFVAVKEDITERKKMLEELIVAKEKAEESDRLKSAFLANISHEIRTPMNGILGFSELLKEPHLSGEEMAEFIDLIQKSGHRMLKLINDLIDISRIDAEETKVEIKETRLNDLMQEIHAFFKPNARFKGLRLTLTTGLSDSESLINTDSGKLSQIVTNLINNALKFTIKGGVDFGYRRKDNCLEFYVIDSGIGIPVAMQDKVFDRFHQVDNSLTRGYEGAGLGLSITNSFVELLGGTIQVESIDGAGTTFSFTLPYNPVNEPEISSPTVQFGYEAASSLCILVAEDDAMSTLLLKKSLKGENITIFCADNGWEAVELIQHHPEINLVLMDIKMPIMNGFVATKHIKQLRPDLPVIAQSAFTSNEEMEKAREAGCDSFITKPISRSELLEKMYEQLKL